MTVGGVLAEATVVVACVQTLKKTIFPSLFTKYPKLGIVFAAIGGLVAASVSCVQGNVVDFSCVANGVLVFAGATGIYHVADAVSPTSKEKLGASDTKLGASDAKLGANSEVKTDAKFGATSEVKTQ